jgi:thymidylate synthase (FAD)
VLDEEFYVPEPEVLAVQSTSNRQGRGEVLDASQAEDIRQLLIEDSVRNYSHYDYLLNDDGSGKPKDPERDMLARELARMDLSLNFYTQWYWKVNLHNNFNFLRLRMDHHAQYEIRVYADAMAQIVRDLTPIAWAAFNDYVLESVHFSGPELRALSMILLAQGVELNADKAKAIALEQGLSKREAADLEQKVLLLKSKKS